jgi:hypothetical protein
MTTRTRLSAATSPRRGYLPQPVFLPRRPHSQTNTRRISNRSYGRLEFNKSPTKQRTGVLSNRSKCGVLRSLIGQCDNDAGARIHQHRKPMRPAPPTARAELPGQSPPCVVDLRAFRLGSRATSHSPLATASVKAKKKPIATFASLRFQLTGCKQGTSSFSNSNKNGISGISAFQCPNSRPPENLRNLESPPASIRRHPSGSRPAAIHDTCHYFTPLGKTNSRVSTSKKSARVLPVPEVYTPGRFLRRSL